MSFFSSRRSSVHGKNGGVATSQPLASQVGIDVLKAGGNAVDAAVTMASTLGVVEPMSTGIGGDIFALIWDPNTEQVASFNGSGTSSRKVLSMAQNLEVKLKKAGVTILGREGVEQADWVLLDACDVIVHLFKPEVREFYGLERMWSASANDESIQVSVD